MHVIPESSGFWFPLMTIKAELVGLAMVITLQGHLPKVLMIDLP